MWGTSAVTFASLALLPSVLGADVLKTDGFTNCANGTGTIKVNNVDISFDRSTNTVNFDVSGESTVEQEVIAELIVSAYGVEVYRDTFDPCSEDTKIDELCPGEFCNISQETPRKC
jgi:hypothetical protein